MRVPDEIKRCVVFFGLPSLNDGALVEMTYYATGFFAYVPFDESRGFMYLVTAKHVAEKLDGKHFVLRANTKDGKAKMFNSPAGDQVKWHFHPTDGNADVAVFPWSPEPSNEEGIDYNVISTTTFLNPKDFNPQGVGIGDEVCIVGLFKGHGGYSKNHPMVRIGNIAMIPDELVETTSGAMEAYLIEARSTGGISGSPVFVAVIDKKARADLTVRTTWAFLGLIHGHWDLPPSKVPSTVDTRVNMGIAIVTPAQKILDILSSEELAAVRREVIERDLGSSSLPVPDA